MKPPFLALIALALCLAAPIEVAAQGAAPPADLLALPRCVWNKLRIDARAPLLSAIEARDAAAIDRATAAIRANTLQSAVACSPSINQDQPTGDEVLLSGLRQEAAGDLINRDLKLSKAQLDRAIATAPAPLTAALRKIANQKANRLQPDPTPSLSPIFTALKLPAAGPANAVQAAWLTSYVLGYHEVRAYAAYYNPNPKE